MPHLETTPIDAVLSRLEGAKPAGKNAWKALCPAHEDRNPSLSIKTAADGTVMLHCHAGCPAKAIVQALGLEMRDLFVREHQKNGAAKAQPKSPPKSYATLEDAIAAVGRSVCLNFPGANLTHRYEYLDSAGQMIGVVCRWDFSSGKEFRQFSPTPNGKWGASGPKGLWPLFEIRTLPREGLIVVVEGEKCCAAATAIGLAATTSAGGSNAAHRTDWSPLAGRDVLILPDQDAPGEKYVGTVARILAELSPPATVKVARLPGLADGEDLVEFVERRHEDGKENSEIVAELFALGKPYKPTGDDNARFEVADERDGHGEGDGIDDINLPAPAPWPVLRPEGMHGIVGDIAQMIAPETEADVVGLYVQLLVAAGSSIGRTAYAQVEGERHHCNFFVITVGKSGHGRKGTSWGRSRQVMQIVDAHWLENCIATGMSSGEGLITRIRDSRIGENAQGEPEIVDAGIADKRLLVVETEFGQTMRNMRRESNTLSAIIRAAWDGTQLSTMTKTALKASNPHVSIIAHVTDAELHDSLERVSLLNGFANRFLWILVRRSKQLPEGGRRLDLSGVGKRLEESIGYARRLEELQRAQDTRDLWAKVYPRLTNPRPGIGGVATSRAEAQVLRLAVLFAALDGSNIIMPDHLKAALSVWDYCEESARIIFGCEEHLDPLAKSILTKLESAGASGMTRTEISGALGNNKPAEKIVGALGKLMELKKARFTKEKTTGSKKPVERWFPITNLRN
jgi:hypothetical protein